MTKYDENIEKAFDIFASKIDEKTLNKLNSISCTSFQMTPNENVEYGHWIYWDGWIGNSRQRIDDAVCSNCGYKHPTIYWTKGDEHNSTPNKLVDICPNCKAVMNKWNGRYKIIF